MSRDEAFEPKLGRIRDRGGARAPSALNHVKAAVARAGGFGAAGKPSARSAFGRGRAAALLARHAPTRRTVVVKARVVRPGTLSTLAAHLAYLSRDGVDLRNAGWTPHSVGIPADLHRKCGQTFPGRARFFTCGVKQRDRSDRQDQRAGQQQGRYLPAVAHGAGCLGGPRRWRANKNGAHADAHAERRQRLGPAGGLMG